MNSVTLGWNAASNATSYVLQYKRASDANWTTAPTSTGTSATITGLAASTAYNFRVQAFNEGDSSSWPNIDVTTLPPNGITMPSNDAPHEWAVRKSQTNNNKLEVVDLKNSRVVDSWSLTTLERLTINSSGVANASLTLDFSHGSFTLPNGIEFKGHTETIDTLYFVGTSGNDAVFFSETEKRFNDLAVVTQFVENFSLDAGQGINEAFVIGTESNSTLNVSDHSLDMIGGGYRLEFSNFNAIDAIAAGRNDKTFIYAENDSLMIMNDLLVERRGQDQLYCVWYSKQVIAINADDSNNAVLHTGSRGYDTYSLASNYGTATNAVGSYYHEFVDFKNVTISSQIISATVSLPTANGWEQKDDRSVWKHGNFNTTVMGNVNVVTRDNSPLAMKAATQLAETPVIETLIENKEIPLTSTAFEMALQPENVLPLDAVLVSEIVPSVAKLETPFATVILTKIGNALLAELHVQEQRKKNKWHGENDGDDWLAEFEKLALLELRK